MAGEIQIGGTTFATESGGTVTLSNVGSATNRTNLGLGSIATQAANSVSISGGNITGGTIGSGVVFPAGHVIKTSEYNIARATYTAVWFPNDDTIPQITEGTEIFSQSYTPSSAATSILIRVNNLFLIETSNVADSPMGALFISGDTDAKLVLLGQYAGGDPNRHHGQLSGEVLVPSWSGAKTISVRKGTGHHAVQYWLDGGWGSTTTRFGLNTCPSATVVVQEIT